ncbi:MAG: rod shape-determining protein MreD [Syntrophobacterales bacterium]|nr:rod shape-determining protein MreD [Syntrophobacterales bacterium]
MIAFLLQPIFIFLLTMLQVTFMEFFSIGPASIDLAFVFVIYAGFWFNPLRGVVLSFMLGFFLDCIVSPIWGLHMFLYVLFFYLAKIAGAQIDRKNSLASSVFTGICLFLQGALQVLFSWLILDVDIIYTLPQIFLPQAIAMGVLSPFIYYVFNYFEGFVNAEVRQSARRL